MPIRPLLPAFSLDGVRECRSLRSGVLLSFTRHGGARLHLPAAATPAARRGGCCLPEGARGRSAASSSSPVAHSQLPVRPQDQLPPAALARVMSEMRSLAEKPLAGMTVRRAASVPSLPDRLSSGSESWAGGRRLARAAGPDAPHSTCVGAAPRWASRLRAMARASNARSLLAPPPARQVHFNEENLAEVMVEMDGPGAPRAPRAPRARSPHTAQA